MATRERDQAAEGADEGGFARSIRAEQTEDFAFADDKIDLIDSDEAAELDRALR